MGIFISLLMIYLDVNESKKMLIIHWKKEGIDETFSYRTHYKNVISFTVFYNMTVMILVITEFILYYSHPSESLQ
jgi:hypothetical protein